MSSQQDDQLLQQLQAELANKEEALLQKDSLCKDQANKIDALVQQMVEMEDNLNHSYNQTLESLYAGMVQMTEEKEHLMQQIESLEAQMKAAKQELEEVHQRVPHSAKDSQEIVDLRKTLVEMEKQLLESDQQMRFLQTSAQKSQDEKRHHRERAHGLQTEVLKLKYLLKDKANALLVARMCVDKNARNLTVPPQWPFLNASEELRTRIAEIESRLSVSNRLVDYLQKQLQKVEEQSDHYEEQQFKMSTELATIKHQLLEKADQLAMSSQKNKKQESEIQDLIKKLQDAEVTLDSNRRDCELKIQRAVESAKTGQSELLHKISQLEFRCTESRRLAEFAQRRFDEMKVEMEESEAKCNATIAYLEFKLKEASRVSEFAQNTLLKKNDEMKQLELFLMGEKKQLEFKLIEASRMAVFLQKKLQDVESKSSVAKLDLQFRLTESTRVAQFLTTNANRISETMQTQRDEIRFLEEQLTVTRDELATARSAIKAKDDLLDSRGVTITELQQQVRELESRLLVSQQLCEFLKTNLSQAEEMNHIAEMEREGIEKKLNVLTNRLSERKMFSRLIEDSSEDTTKSMSESDQDSLTSSNADDMDISRDYERQIADLEFRLTESQRLSKFVQSKLQTLDTSQQQQIAKYEAEIAHLKFKATESLRIATFAQDAFMKASQEKRAIETDRAAQKVKEMFQISEADRMIQFMSKKLKDTESQYEAKIKDLEYKLAEATASASNGDKFKDTREALSVAYPHA
ncbi:laminin, alpha 1/2 [Fistulifera solaris]|uniref:Laminin, alpha 1/2 n=1 Tax=Fistulifera solaris TaxID=1519565 RepID=A0A1Z5JX37_FISSO|nr:laminin, alpha 1/2 [Fistulifera solaris]|eukprot:GAX18436.1 laminin, alpha 1/2 [Fistulifera solaris]